MGITLTKCININAAISPTTHTNEVDRQLELAAEKDKFNFKILLLGAGESGKSTVVKQIKLIWKVNGGMTDQEKYEYTDALKRNVIEVMQTLIEAAQYLDISLFGEEEKEGADDTELEVYAREVLEADVAAEGGALLTPELAEKITTLWQSKGIQKTFERREEFWCLDATPYYLNEAMRIAECDFEPNEEDVIMTRVRTTGIVVTQLPEPPYNYQIVDVGGQRSERRKWINCFDDVKGIIFLEGLSGYNQVLFEDTTCNRMHESLNLFAEVVKNPIFKNTPIFVFLNKKDLFEEMIPHVSLRNCFPEYDGPDGEALPALEYIQQKYRDVMASYCPNKALHIQVIAARLRMDMKVAFAEVKDKLKQLYSPEKKYGDRGSQSTRRMGVW